MTTLVLFAALALSQPVDEDHPSAAASVEQVEQQLEQLETAMEARNEELSELRDLTTELLQAVGYTAEEAAAEMGDAPEFIGPPLVKRCASGDTGLACTSTPEKEDEAAIEAVPEPEPAPAID